MLDFCIITCYELSSFNICRFTFTEATQKRRILERYVIFIIAFFNEDISYPWEVLTPLYRNNGTYVRRVYVQREPARWDPGIIIARNDTFNLHAANKINERPRERNKFIGGPRSSLTVRPYRFSIPSEISADRPTVAFVNRTAINNVTSTSSAFSSGFYFVYRCFTSRRR